MLASTHLSLSALDSPAVTVSWAVLFTEPCGLEAVQQNRPPSSGKASAITKVHISSTKRNTNHQHTLDKINKKLLFIHQTIKVCLGQIIGLDAAAQQSAQVWRGGAL